jgi:hypothetical protein
MTTNALKIRAIAQAIATDAEDGKIDIATISKGQQLQEMLEAEVLANDLAEGKLEEDANGAPVPESVVTEPGDVADSDEASEAEEEAEEEEVIKAVEALIEGDKENGPFTPHAAHVQGDEAINAFLNARGDDETQVLDDGVLRS